MNGGTASCLAGARQRGIKLFSSSDGTHSDMLGGRHIGSQRGNLPSPSERSTRQARTKSRQGGRKARAIHCTHQVYHVSIQTVHRDACQGAALSSTPAGRAGGCTAARVSLTTPQSLSKLPPLAARMRKARMLRYSAALKSACQRGGRARRLGLARTARPRALHGAGCCPQARRPSTPCRIGILSHG